MNEQFANAIVSFDCEEISEAQFADFCESYVEMTEVLLSSDDTEALCGRSWTQSWRK